MGDDHCLLVYIHVLLLPIICSLSDRLLRPNVHEDI